MAVIIGAMVIASLLSPNLALTVGSALGEFKLIAYSLEQTEILSRTKIHISTVILALASGGVAILSMTTKLSGSFGRCVMVAVAILLPASVLDLMLGSGLNLCLYFILAGFIDSIGSVYKAFVKSSLIFVQVFHCLI